MNFYSTIIFLILLILSCSSPKNSDPVTVIKQPAEFDPQEALWLIWPSTNHKEGESVEKVTLSIIESLIQSTKVVVTCKNQELLLKLKKS